jgi:hypothetical protein
LFKYVDTECYCPTRTQRNASVSLSKSSSTLKETNMGLAGMALSAIAAAAGAIMYWAITYQGTGFRFSTVGVILMIAGAFGFIVSSIVFAVSRRPERPAPHTIDRQVVNSDGASASMHEDVK